MYKPYLSRPVVRVVQRFFHSVNQTNFNFQFSLDPINFNYRLPSQLPQIDEFPNYPISTPTHQNSSLHNFFQKVSPQYLQSLTPLEYFDSFPLTTFDELSQSNSPKSPNNVKILTSDFITDSMYNRNYGYLSKKGEILSVKERFQFENIKNMQEFTRIWYDKYLESSKNVGYTTVPPSANSNQQLWHTPVELFDPYYGEAIARYILVNYKLNLYPYEDLVIYEVGGGNGTLMKNILNYIRRNEPDIFKITSYKIIEISEQGLSQRFKDLMAKGDLHNKVEIVNTLFFKWNTIVPENCFVLGLEILRNLAHDVIKYDLTTMEPYQGYVVIEDNGGIRQFWNPELSHESKVFLSIMAEYKRDYPLSHPLNSINFKYKLAILNKLTPLLNNLTNSEFIPTDIVKFFLKLKHYFPNHQLLLADFTNLPTSRKINSDFNSPILIHCQSQKTGISSYLKEQGDVDILFSTDFQQVLQLYTRITGKLANVADHEEFMRQWADYDICYLKDGRNPLLEVYTNSRILFS